MTDSVATLIKITKQKIIRQRNRMTGLEQQLYECEQTEKRLTTALTHEKNFVRNNADALLSYMTFYQSNQQKMIKLAQDKEAIIGQLNIEQERLARLFREQKTYEVYQQQKLNKKLLMKETALQNATDELTLIKTALKRQHGS